MPVSLAGWGVREMSAVFALGAIGVASGNALLSALVVGAGSLIAMAALSAISLSSWREPAAKRLDIAQSLNVNYGTLLAYAVPLAVATLVLFQIHVPLASGTLLNVNLADPIALLGGAMFLLQSVQRKQVPEWRVPHLNLAVAATTLVLVIALFIGAARFGFTEWAVVNRFFGWFVVLSYAMTGALMFRAASADSTRLLLLTFIGATMAIVLLELSLLTAVAAGARYKLSLPVFTDAISGFAQNRNSFAFQILMALAATFVVAQGRRQRQIIVTTLLLGLWFTGSRSGWIAVSVLFIAAIYLRAVSIRELAPCALPCLILAITPLALTWMVVPPRPTDGAVPIIAPTVTPLLVPTATDTDERMLSLRLGWDMFLTYPLFGGGLGAFRNLGITDGVKPPLLVHSTPLWLLAETGFVGLIVFVTPVVAVLLKEWRRRDRDKASDLLILCILVFAVMSLPADLLYQRTFWMIAGAGLAIRIAQRAGSSEELHAAFADIRDPVRADNDANVPLKTMSILQRRAG